MSAPRPVRKKRGAERLLIRPQGCDREPPAAWTEGLNQLDEGCYWDCHETLEEAWRAEPSDLRYLYQGVLLVAVGLLHLERGNRHGAVVKLDSGTELLRRFEPECLGLDVGSLRAEAEQYLRTLRENPSDLAPALSLPRPRSRRVPYGHRCDLK